MREVFDDQNLDLTDDPAEYGPDRDHQWLVVLEHRPEDGFVLLVGELIHLLDDGVLEVDHARRVVLRLEQCRGEALQNERNDSVLECAVALGADGERDDGTGDPGLRVNRCLDFLGRQREQLVRPRPLDDAVEKDLR